MTNSFAVNKVIHSLAIASLLYAEGLLGSTAAHATIPTVLANPQIVAQAGQVKVAPFAVNVTLTEAARQRLASPKETIIVSVSVSGEPQKNSSIKVNETGLVDLVNQQVELSKAGRAQFNSLFVPVSTVNQLASKDYKVNVNVFSGRRSSQDNLLACDFFDGKISKIQPGIMLKCGLIGEYTSQYINSSSSPVPENSSRPANAVRGLW